MTNENTQETNPLETEIENSKNRKGGDYGRFYYVDLDVMEQYGITKYELAKDKSSSRAIRIIKPSQAKMWPKQIFKHEKIGSDEHTFLCLRKMYNERCPICEAIDKLKRKNSDDETTQGWIKALYPRGRWLLFVYDVRDAEHEAQGLHWWDAPEMAKNQICVLSSRERNNGALIDVSDPNEGRDILFEFDGKKCLSFGFIDKGPVPKEWLTIVPQTYEEVLKKPTYEEVAKEIPPDIFGEERVRTEPVREVAKPVVVQEKTTVQQEVKVEPVVATPEPKGPVTRTPVKAAVTRGGSTPDDVRRQKIQNRIDALKGESKGT